MRNSLFVLALPGLGLAFGLALLAYFVSVVYPLFDAFFLAFAFALIVGMVIPKKEQLWIGLALCKDLFIPLGLLLYGTQVQWKHTFQTLPTSVFLLCGLNILLYTVVVWSLNRFWRVDDKISLLTGPANGICGVSAAAVFIPFVQAREKEVTAALTAIFVVGLLSLSVCIFLLAPRMESKQYALLTGSTLNQTGAVKVASQVQEGKKQNLALQIKYFRTALIIPTCLVLLLLSRKLFYGTQSQKLKRKNLLYALFLFCLFFGASCIFSFSSLGEYQKSLKPIFKVVFSMTLVSVGLLCDFRKAFTKEVWWNMVSTAIAWVVVAGSTFILLQTL